MKPKGNPLKSKTVIIRIMVFTVLFSGFLGLMKYGAVYFSPKQDISSLFDTGKEKDKIVQEEFFNAYQEFSHALEMYVTRPPFLIGFAFALLAYGWMIIRLFASYFHFFKGILWLDFLLHPRTLENIPHCLVVLFFYFIYLGSSAHSTIMMMVFVLISIPFVYKIMEDVFIIAEKEGTVEIYLNKRKTNRKLMVEFLSKRLGRLVIIPVLFLVMLMIYWDFLYGSIDISADSASAPAIFFSNFNNEFLVGDTSRHNVLVWFHIGLFILMMFAILYLVSFPGEEENE